MLKEPGMNFLLLKNKKPDHGINRLITTQVFNWMLQRRVAGVKRETEHLSPKNDVIIYTE